MPDYTDPWDSSIPDGASTLASDTDTELQKIRIGMHERMDDVVIDWLADPVVFPQFGEGLQFAKRYDYNATVVTLASLLKASLLINFRGNTDAAGNISVDFNEFAEVYDLTDINIQTKIVGPFYDSLVNDFVFGYFVSAFVGTKIVTWNVRKWDGGNVINHFIEGDILLYFNTVPV